MDEGLRAYRNLNKSPGFSLRLDFFNASMKSGVSSGLISFLTSSMGLGV